MAKKMYVTAMVLYSTTVVLLFSALVSDRWIVHTNEKIRGITHETSSLIWMAFIVAFAGFALLWWRTVRSGVGSWAKIVSICGIGFSAVLGISGIMLFQKQVRTNPGETYGFGYNTTLAAAINAFVPFAILVLHETLYRQRANRDRMSGVQLKLVTSFILFFVYLEFGGICYSYIEDWPVVNSLLFAMATCTSIGYGATTVNPCNLNYRNEGAYPVTTGGRIFTLFYLPIGYALLGWFIKCLWDVIILTVNRRVKGAKKGDSAGPISDRAMFIYGASGTIGIMLLGALIFSLSERWTYWDAFWFCFVTLTTVGYGDMVPNPQHYYFFFIWLVVGLGCVAYFLNSISKLLVEPIANQAAVVDSTRKADVAQILDDYQTQMSYVLNELSPEKAQMQQIAWATVRQAIHDADDRFFRAQTRMLVGISPSAGSNASSRDSFASVRSSVDRPSAAGGAYGDITHNNFAHYAPLNFVTKSHPAGGGGGGARAGDAQSNNTYAMIPMQVRNGGNSNRPPTELFPPGVESPYFPYRPPMAPQQTLPSQQQQQQIQRSEPHTEEKNRDRDDEQDQNYHLLKD